MDKTVGHWLQRASRLHRAKIAEAVADLGLFPGQEQTLLALAAGKSMTVGNLAETLKVRPPTVSKTLARLAAQKLIERSGHDKDARKSTVVLTKEGAKRAKALVARMEEVERSLLAELDGKDEKRLRKLLKRVTRAMAGDAETEIDVDDDVEV